jgi:hypothetical protein
VSSAPLPFRGADDGVGVRSDLLAGEPVETRVAMIENLADEALTDFVDVFMTCSDIQGIDCTKADCDSRPPSGDTDNKIVCKMEGEG